MPRALLWPPKWRICNFFIRIARTPYQNQISKWERVFFFVQNEFLFKKNIEKKIQMKTPTQNEASKKYSRICVYNLYIMRMLVKLQFNNIVCFSVFCVWCGVSVSFLNANKDDSHCILLRCFALVFFYRIFSFVAFVCRSVAQSLSFNVIRLLIALCAFFLCLSVDLSVSLFWFQTNQHVHCIETSMGLAIPNPMKATEKKTREQSDLFLNFS